MCKKRLLLVLLLFVAILSVTACSVSITKGSGDLVTETRQVSNFDRIDLSGSGEVIVTQGGSESLSIETDDNVMKHIKAEVENGTLKLGFKNGVNLITPTRLVFYVGVDDLTNLTISGSGELNADTLVTDLLDMSISGSGGIQIADLSASQVKADISGSGEISLTGEVTSQDVSISGSGNYLTGNICSELVKVSVSGSGGATVCAIDTLNADVSGSGSVFYYGQPSVNSSNSGSGSINSLGEK